MNKKFIKRVLLIAIPVAIQNLISNVLNISDTFMISKLGTDYVSAVGLSNKIFFVLSLLLFGFTSGLGILLSQYYGKGDEKRLNKVFGLLMGLVFTSGIIFTVVTLIIPEKLIGLFTTSQALIDIGKSYLRIVCLSYTFTALSLGIAGLLKSISKARVPMMVTILCVGINILINYILIYGNFGAPMMYANGAAIGTLIARIVEFSILLLYLIFSKKDFSLKLKVMFSLDKEIINQALKLAIPVIINETLWGIGTTMYSVIYGHMSDSAVATMTIATTLQDLVYAFLFGFSNACAVLVGNDLGAGKLDDAKKTARRLLISATSCSVLLAFVLIALINPYLMLYDTVDESIKHDIFIVCSIFAALMPFRTFNLLIIVGILRSGADTLFCMLLDVLSVWAYAIPMGVLAAFVFKFPVYIVYLFIFSEEFVKFFIGVFRYKQYKWVKNITLN